MTIGPQWDTYDFLSNALYFANQGYGYIDLIRPPFISFLTSLLFRLGFISELTIFFVDGGLFFMGVVGFYLLLKQRFKDVYSFLGSLIFISFPVILLWVGAGYTDVASMSLSIWAIYFTVLAVRNDSKYFYLSFIFFTLSFLTRFSAAILIFPVFFYLFINRDRITNLKRLVKGFLASAILMVPVLIFFYQMTGSPFTVFMNFYGASVSGSLQERFAYNPDLFFYLKNSFYCLINTNLLNYEYGSLLLFFMFIFLVILPMIGIIFFGHGILRSLKKYSMLNDYKNHIITALVLIILFILSIGRVNYLISDLLFLGFLYFLYGVLVRGRLKYLDFDLMFWGWLVSFLVFSSVHDIKVYRYLVPMTPAIAYFMILGLCTFLGKIKLLKRPILGNHPLSMIIIVLIAVCTLVSSASFLYQLEHDSLSNGNNFEIVPEADNLGFYIASRTYTGELYSENYDTHHEIIALSDWIKNYDPQYKNKVIYSEYFWPHLRWYLRINVLKLQDRGNINLNNELLERKADYYIALGYLTLADYTNVYELKTDFGTIVVYKRNSNHF